MIRPAPATQPGPTHLGQLLCGQRGEPAVPRLRLKFSSAWVTELLSGAVDAVQGIDVGTAVGLERDPRFRVYRAWVWESIRALWWNHRDPLFRDARVRQALTHDRARARALLAEAGWSDRDGDGVLERDGRPFRFTLMVPDIWYGSNEIAVLVQDQLKRVGVQVDLGVLEYAQYWERAWRGEFVAALHHFWSGMYEKAFSESSVIGYRSPGFAALLEELRGTADPERLDSLHQELSRVFARDMPVTPLFPLMFVSAVNRRVVGYEDIVRAELVPFAGQVRLDVPR